MAQNQHKKTEQPKRILPQRSQRFGELETVFFSVNLCALCGEWVGFKGQQKTPNAEAVGV